MLALLAKRHDPERLHQRHAGRRRADAVVIGLADARRPVGIPMLMPMNFAVIIGGMATTIAPRPTC